MSASAPLGDHDLARLFPTEGETAFGTWVKAGALKLGDRVSTRGSVEGAREAANDNGTAANDNEALTLRSIERDDRDQRVYNFAVQSLPGEVTHNYLVGDAEWWTHNAKKRDIKQFESAFREIARRLGRPLTRKDRRRLHDEITKQGCDRDEIIEIGEDLLRKG